MLRSFVWCLPNRLNRRSLVWTAGACQKILCLFIFIYSFGMQAQSLQLIKGQVVDSLIQKPLSDVGVYLNGTTFGTITDQHGLFRLKIPRDLKTELVISYVGYKSVRNRVSSKQDTVDLGRIYLREGEKLKLVEITVDPWSREKKLRFFRRWFLGKVKPKDCHIQNEEVLRLRFDPEKNKLTAYAEEPLNIENAFLDYDIRYSLKDFELNFDLVELRDAQTNKTDTFHRPRSVYFNGQSFFKERHKRVRRRYRKRREKTYKGSRLQFMRALASKTLEEKGYKIYHNHYQYPTYRFFDIKRKNKLSKITLTTNNISIVYDDKRQTDLLTHLKNTVFYIDNFGNYTPSNAFFLMGDMATYRVGKMLPLDY